MLKEEQRSSPITHPVEAQHGGNAASQVKLAECAGMQEPVLHLWALAWMAGASEHVVISDSKAGVVLKDAVLPRMLGRPHLDATCIGLAWWASGTVIKINKSIDSIVKKIHTSISGLERPRATAS